LTVLPEEVLELVVLEVLELEELVSLLDKRYPSESVKFRAVESGNLVASLADLTTFHIVHMTS